METLWIVLGLLLITRFGAAIAGKLSLPALVGEITGGVVLGLLVNQAGIEIFPSDADANHHLMALSDLGIFFLMLLGGFEMRPKDLVNSGSKGLAIAIAAMLLPLSLGFFYTWSFLPESLMRFEQSMLVGTALAITAVPVTIKVFLDLGMLDTAIGKLVVAAAVFDDFLSLILLSIVVAILGTGGLPGGFELITLFAKVLLFLMIAIMSGLYLLPPIARWSNRSDIEEINTSLLILFAAALAVLAEILELHFILGAFAAGLFYSKHTVNPLVYSDLEKFLKTITNGLLAPIFFASIGYQLDPSAFADIPVFLIGLVAIAFFGKLIGASAPSYLMGFSKTDSLMIGFAMNARGAVGLIIAGIALESGVFLIGGESPSLVSESLFSAIVIVVILTTVLAPVGTKVLAKTYENESC
ncbi:MAG: potassium transporter [marine bacterium B5-7]|nr:MAG: potassium transporter [marine bacterium B5-7]